MSVSTSPVRLTAEAGAAPAGSRFSRATVCWAVKDLHAVQHKGLPAVRRSFNAVECVGRTVVLAASRL